MTVNHDPESIVKAILHLVSNAIRTGGGSSSSSIVRQNGTAMVSYGRPGTRTTLISNCCSSESPGDLLMRPHRLPSNHWQDWPSIVLEVACSETKSKLGSSVRFWMRGSDGDVKFVLTLRINRQQPKIGIEKWVSSGSSGNNNRHRLDQSVTISKADSNRIILSNAPLTIDFQDLFLRPASIPRERDIELDAEKLQDLATEI